MLLVATALRDRFPKVAAVFADGLIGYRMVRTIVTRAALVTDPEAFDALDEALAEALAHLGTHVSRQDRDRPSTRSSPSIDPHAVRRTQTQARSRSVDILIEDGSGLAAVFATLFTPDATAVEHPPERLGRHRLPRRPPHHGGPLGTARRQGSVAGSAHRT